MTSQKMANFRWAFVEALWVFQHVHHRYLLFNMTALTVDAGVERLVITNPLT
jgi:hypothetical protein